MKPSFPGRRRLKNCCGGGPIGSELGQAHRRLGCEVTILDIAKTLNDDPEPMEVVRTRMQKEGVVIREEIEILSVEKDGGGVAVNIDNGQEERVTDRTAGHRRTRAQSCRAGLRPRSRLR